MVVGNGWMARRRQRVADVVGTGQPGVERGAIFGKQGAEPVASEGPEAIAAQVAFGAETSAEARVEGVNGFRAGGEFVDPAAWKGGVEPTAGFFEHRGGDGAGADWGVGL